MSAPAPASAPNARRTASPGPVSPARRPPALRWSVVGACLLVGGGLGLSGVALDGWARWWLRGRLATAAEQAAPAERPARLAALADFDEAGLAAATRWLADTDPGRRGAATGVLRRRLVGWRAEPSPADRRRMTVVLTTLADLQSRLPEAEAAFAAELAETTLTWPVDPDDPARVVACERILLDPLWAATTVRPPSPGPAVRTAATVEGAASR